MEESNQEREELEAEVVSLREEVKKGKTIQTYANSSRALEELINNQGSKRNFLSKEDSSSSDEADNDSEEEANERVFFMAKNNKPKHKK